MLLGLSLLASASKAEAEPFLQLDILGGHYDALTQTIVAGSGEFTLLALLTPQTNTTAAQLSGLLNETYYISAAVSPQAGPTNASIGSFSWGVPGTPNVTYNVTSDMTYGTPPLEGFLAATDPGDLASHGIFPTFFRQFNFQFSSANRSVTYNSADQPGGLTPTSATSNVSYYQLFNLTTALAGDNVLHFDLYNTALQECGNNRSCTPGDVDVNKFAPFSHDAESTTNRVPEPGSMALVSVGLALGATVLRRRRFSA